MTVEVWHGGIPDDAPRAGAGVVRCSDKPFSIPWPLWIEHHTSPPPDLVVHVYR
jgi:hypothetical protein